MKYNEFDFKICVMSFLKKETGTFFKLDIETQNIVKITINKNTLSRAKYKQLTELNDLIKEENELIDITEYVIRNCFNNKTIVINDSDDFKIAII